MNIYRNFDTTLKTLGLLAGVTSILFQTALAEPNKDVKTPLPITPEARADGKYHYETHCANCHGVHAQGAAKAGIEISIIAERGGKQPPDLTDSVWDHGSSDSAITASIKNGISLGMMPSFEGRLTDIQISNVIGYVRSLSATTTAVVTSGSATAPSLSPKPKHTLEVADYFELPLTGDMSSDRVSGPLARGSILREEPGGKRFFVNDLTGPLYIIDKKTKRLSTYLNFDGSNGRAGLFPKFTAAQGYAAGLINFTFDPDYKRNGIIYTLHMETPGTPGENVGPRAGAVPGLKLKGYTTTPALATPTVPNPALARDLVIIEWTDHKRRNTTFEGTAREVFRMQVPVLFHPLNEITFNPYARPGDPDWRVMYLGIGDAGTGERPGPMRMHAQRLDTLHGKILRIIPMLNEHKSTSIISENGRYRIPNDNPFVSVEGARKEIWAYGLRNPHRLAWYANPVQPNDPVLLAFNIGLVSWETVAIVKKGANYGYPLREGAQSMTETNGVGPLPENDVLPVRVTDTLTHGTVVPTYPVVAYSHGPEGGDAIANGFVYRGKRISLLKDSLVFGDITTGRVWFASMKDVLAADDGIPSTLATHHELGTQLRALSEATYRKRSGTQNGLPGRGAVAGNGRIDIRLAEDDDGELYVLTKGDGMIRKFHSVELNEQK